MITAEVPGLGKLELENLVLDFNGNLAVDGNLLPGVAERINKLAEKMQVYVLTADTFGTARKACEGLNIEFGILTEEIGAPEKEGAAAQTLMAADIVVRDINDALDLLLNPKRIVATLRR